MYNETRFDVVDRFTPLNLILDQNLVSYQNYMQNSTSRGKSIFALNSYTIFCTRVWFNSLIH